MTDTIAAIATPPGAGGIGIIRVSGSRAIEVVCALFGKKPRSAADQQVSTEQPVSRDPQLSADMNTSPQFITPNSCASSFTESHRVTHGYIFDTVTGNVLDEVLVIPMFAPRSYTAEDVVEIHAHSGPIVMQTILEQVLSMGVRLAQPGEFTKRAFLNGRIDLTQAEAVADIINARSSNSLKIALSQGLGYFKSTVTNAREELIELLTKVEALIDFPEDTGDILPADHAIEVIMNIMDICNNGIKQYEDAHFLRDGLKLSICGPPNVGKSSLMNRLLEKERSIVTAFPGTTRDLIEESLNINGIPFVISDTAGMHKTDDPVEKIGIERARQHILESDMILFMEDVESVKRRGVAIIKKELEAIVPGDKKTVLVLNKVDKINKEDLLTLPAETSAIPIIAISATQGIGIDNLRKKITQIATSNLNLSSLVVPNLRHKTALKKASSALEQARQNLSGYCFQEETLAIDIRSAIDFLGEITGDGAGIDILDQIFSKFCIGK
ncbi:MAG: tRNA uridine-5-carboxymethylaminomethyl(34) synthesis GTPase MnmE [Desulfamplus sp.]|nr:tRNA uridine-5-carboxymethylaminomethyl(34) synthesis GTPase MnmE [Desulfamplus sp.]